MSRAATASTILSRSTEWPSPGWPILTGCCGSTPARPGMPLSLTKPIGTGILNAMHKATGEISEAAIAVMTTLNAAASLAALAAGLRCATDVTGFGLLGHAFKLARASGVSAVIDHRAVPVIEGTRQAQRAGHMPGGSRRNLAWVAPHAEFGDLSDDELLLLADAQTSGGLLACRGNSGRDGHRRACATWRQCHNSYVAITFCSYREDFCGQAALTVRTTSGRLCRWPAAAGSSELPPFATSNGCHSSNSRKQTSARGARRWCSAQDGDRLWPRARRFGACRHRPRGSRPTPRAEISRGNRRGTGYLATPA